MVGQGLGMRGVGLERRALVLAHRVKTDDLAGRPRDPAWWYNVGWISTKGRGESKQAKNFLPTEVDIVRDAPGQQGGPMMTWLEERARGRERSIDSGLKVLVKSRMEQLR